jgi:hypothetical protein
MSLCVITAHDLRVIIRKERSDSSWVEVAALMSPCMSCRYFAHKGELAGTANALKLVKALKNKMWESTTQQCRCAFIAWLG